MTSQSEQVQRLLATLANYTSQNQNDESQPPQAAIPSSTSAFVSHLPGLGSLAPEAYQSALSKPSTPSPASYQRPDARRPPEAAGVGDPRMRLHSSTAPTDRSPTPTNPPSKTPIPDASTITDWPTAIRHVMQHLLPQPEFGTRIRRLISTQHQYEEDWFAKRQLITARHASRETSAAQLTSIFANLGVPTPPPSSAHRDLEAEQRELAQYDSKVYKQLLALVGDFDRQLRQLGVPFYAIRHELVILMDAGKDKAAAAAPPPPPPPTKGRIDRGELRELQRRMLEWLEMSFPAED